jgi:hypothetical protein
MAAIVSLDARSECWSEIKKRYPSTNVTFIHADCLNFQESKLVSELNEVADANPGEELYAIMHFTLGDVTDHPRQEEAELTNARIVSIVESCGFKVKVIRAQEGACAIEMADFVGEFQGK